MPQFNDISYEIVNPMTDEKIKYSNKLRKPFSDDNEVFKLNNDNSYGVLMHSSILNKPDFSQTTDYKISFYRNENNG